MQFHGVSNFFSELKNFGRKIVHFVKILRAGRSCGLSLGFSNFLEYAFGGRALVKDNNLSPSAKIIIKEGAEFLAIEYQQRLGANDIIYVIEHSTDLSTWESVDRLGLERIFDNGDGTISYSYRILNIDDLGKQSYLRVKVVGR